ncbi:unconventional myosin-XVI-like [Pomacea canaliculata]|uniref:unconventional myosin-XVI-like n=1 Tax=Pomacea canaliculata TaxID=400727 RepID=UPI000D72BB04|nr:unconventional myosin-XVI-like [Pomacea canaliculata]
METRDILVPEERIKMCREMRTRQVENYKKFMALQEQQQPQPQRLFPRKPNKKGTTVHFHSSYILQSAIEEVDGKQVLTLLNTGADYNFKTGNGSSLLHKCCAEGNVAMAELLVLKGADVNAADDDWWTPLHVACYQDNADIVQLLLTNEADLSLMDVDGNFPIDHAPQHTDSWETIISFMEAKGLTERKMKKLRQLRGRQVEDEVRAIIQTSRDVSKAVTSDGVTFLHMACANGYTKCGQLLLKHGAQVNAVTTSGWTPLHCSAKFCQAKMVELLLKHGADTSCVNHEGNTAQDVAMGEEIQKLIRKARCAERKSATGGGSMEETADGEEEHSGSVSRIMRPFRLPLSKADRLMEGQTLLYGGTFMTLETGQPDIDLSSTQTSRKEETVVDDDNDSYKQVFISSVYSMHSSEKGELPLPGTDDDLSKLPSLSEEIILDAILQRYSRSQIYTYIGDVIIAVNPFTELPLYGQWASRIFRRHDPGMSLPPHIYAVAERARRALLSSQTDQCCVIGGESGAGKTETCKLLVQHLMNSSASVEHRLNEKLHQANPLLEAFGNAQTTRNHNSSRFAKYMELIFAPDGCVLGGHVHEYLLEKSRVVQQGPGEGNFHIFYWMLNGTTPEEKSQLFLEHNNFKYLRNSVPQEVKADNQQKLLEIKECMKLIGFSQNDLTNMLSTLAAVLHLGDVTFFESDDTGGAMVIDSCILTRVSKLLQVPFEDLVSALTVDVLMARGEELRKTLSVAQACDNRDALAKALYNRLFSWIVNGINQLVAPLEDSPDKKLCFGILDIFGFENLEKNDFEQMCINLANEQMQVFYQQQVFQQEIADCLAEEVPPVEVTFPSGQEVVDVFMQRNTGIFDLLDEESCFPKATDKTLATKLHNSLGKKYNRVYKSPKSGGTSFTIVHYAGTVQYHLAGVLEKNRDTLHSSLTFVMQSSDNMLVKEIFQSAVTRTGSISPSARQRITRKIKPSCSPFEFFKRFHKSKQGPKKMKEVANLKTKKSSTLTFHFQNSLKEMVTKLEFSAPHFVHCIKPNQTLEALTADRKYVSIQLCYGGILQTAIVRKDGYAVRCSFQEFVEKYPALIMFQKPKKPRSDYQQQSAALLSTFSIPISQVGCNKVFLHLHQARELDAHEAALNVKVIITQSVVRRFLARHLASKLRKSREVYTQKELSQREVKTTTEDTSPEEELIAKENEEEEESIYGHVFDDDQEIFLRKKPRDRLTGVPADVQHSLDFLDDVIREFTSNTRELDLKQDSDDADGEDDAYQDAVSLYLHQTSRKSDSEHRGGPSHSEQLTQEFEMNRKHNHNSLHLHQQHQQYYSQDVLHDPPTRAFPPLRGRCIHMQLSAILPPLMAISLQDLGADGLHLLFPSAVQDTHLTSQPHSSRKSSISSRESTSSSDLCNEVNEVFDASPQHSYQHHQHHHQYNPATATNSRFVDSRPFSYAAGIDPRVLQQRQQCTNSPVNNNRSRVVSEGFAAGDMSYSDTQGRGFQPYGEPESWHVDSGKHGSGDSGFGLNGHAHGAPPASHAGGPASVSHSML